MPRIDPSPWDAARMLLAALVLGMGLMVLGVLALGVIGLILDH